MLTESVAATFLISQYIREELLTDTLNYYEPLLEATPKESER